MDHKADDFGKGAVFTLNKDFKNKRHRIKITASLAKETAEGRSQTIKAVNEDRKFYLQVSILLNLRLEPLMRSAQAAIVRIMKSRKQLQHNLLIASVVEHSSSRFVPNVHLIKKCIEQLIDKGYLERAENAKGVYNYLA